MNDSVVTVFLLVLRLRIQKEVSFQISTIILGTYICAKIVHIHKLTAVILFRVVRNIAPTTKFLYIKHFKLQHIGFRIDKEIKKVMVYVYVNSS